jgi:hypothetical protein
VPADTIRSTCRSMIERCTPSCRDSSAAVASPVARAARIRSVVVSNRSSGSMPATVSGVLPLPLAVVVELASVFGTVGNVNVRPWEPPTLRRTGRPCSHATLLIRVSNDLKFDGDTNLFAIASRHVPVPVKCTFMQLASSRSVNITKPLCHNSTFNGTVVTISSAPRSMFCQNSVLARAEVGHHWTQPNSGAP